MRIELRRPAHGLAGIVDDVVETAAGFQQVRAKRLDAGRMAQVQSENVQARGPLRKVFLACIAFRRVARKACGDDQFGAGTQEFQPGLVTDLHAPTGQQCNASAEVSQFVALGMVERGTLRTQLVVKVVNQRILLLADIAMLGIGGLPMREILAVSIPAGECFRREHIGCGEHRPCAQLADARGVEQGIVPTCLAATLFLRTHLHALSTQDRIRVIDASNRLMQRVAVFRRQLLKQGPVFGYGTQGLRGGAQLLDQIGCGIVRGLVRFAAHVDGSVLRGAHGRTPMARRHHALICTVSSMNPCRVQPASANRGEWPTSAG